MLRIRLSYHGAVSAEADRIIADERMVLYDLYINKMFWEQLVTV
jgi:hypothetical protein